MDMTIKALHMVSTMFIPECPVDKKIWEQSLRSYNSIQKLKSLDVMSHDIQVKFNGTISKYHG